MKQIDKLNRFSRKNNTFIRTYLSGLKEVELDANFRILIPKDLMIFANLKKDIVFSSSLNMIEVWSKDNYEKSIKSSLNNFPDLVEDVMGGPEKMNRYHIPVMLEESIDALNIINNGIYVDAKFGSGGHSKNIRKIKERKLYAFDKDGDSNKNFLKDDRFKLFISDYKYISNI